MGEAEKKKIIIDTDPGIGKPPQKFNFFFLISVYFPSILFVKTQLGRINLLPRRCDGDICSASIAGSRSDRPDDDLRQCLHHPGHKKRTASGNFVAQF